ncbi:serine/threonine-protein phosphatase 6 regulatory ankyrin repeat subunit B-like isoform X2 [Corticium candelabrum]|uniref:serine/threonine-protein phosphatase 6 regulatory ankyrin repeat subunit B-like isoform X2 n=1 Tax=Corticium candelabrum TaxID=121492 RepID=UPI002E276673|nr:serine/threonine-protein phosphatase 6 regulatory ankyrin repeat subunit B-like isoform X2 [Corticium candelabrum]
MGNQIGRQVERGDIESVTRLLEMGADVNARDLFGYTLLIQACRNNQKEMVEFLLAKSADVNGTNWYGYTALIVSASIGSEDITDLLLNVKDINVMKKDTFGGTAIHHAAVNNHVTIVERLLCCSGPVDINDNYGHTPLWWAAFDGRVCCVDVLLKHGANPQHESKYGSPLKVAKQRGHSDVVEMMEEAIRLRSRLYVERDVSIMRHQYEETIAELQSEVEKKTEELRQSSLDHEIEVTTLRNEIQQKEKEIRRLRMSAADRVGERQVSPEAWLLMQLPGDVMDAVVALAGDQWSDVALKLGYRMSQLNSITSSIPTPSGKLNAILNRKADSVGTSNVVGIILSACQRIPLPICAAAIREEVVNHRD